MKWNKKRLGILVESVFSSFMENIYLKVNIGIKNIMNKVNNWENDQEG